MSVEFELFKGTNFSDLMRDVYHNSKKKSRQIDLLIKNLEPMIKDYLEVSVKNDDALVKLAAVVQRLVTANSKDDDGNEFGLSEEERKRLLEEAENEIQSIKEQNKPEIDQNVITTETTDLSSNRD